MWHATHIVNLSSRPDILTATDTTPREQLNIEHSSGGNSTRVSIGIVVENFSTYRLQDARSMTSSPCTATREVWALYSWRKMYSVGPKHIRPKIHLKMYRQTLPSFSILAKNNLGKNSLVYAKNYLFWRVLAKISLTLARCRYFCPKLPHNSLLGKFRYRLARCFGTFDQNCHTIHFWASFAIDWFVLAKYHYRMTWGKNPVSVKHW